MNAADLRKKSMEELKKELDGLMKDQFALRMQNGSGQGVRPHLFNALKKDIARVKTIMTEVSGK